MQDEFFFWRAAMAALSSLELEESMRRCVAVLAESMPADQLMVHLYDHGLGAMRTVAVATPERGERVDLLTPIPPQGREESYGRSLEPVRMVNGPGEDPIADVMVDAFGYGASSLLLVMLQPEGMTEPLGHLTLRAQGGARYSEEDLRRFALLREPFALALTNALRHGELEALRWRLEEEVRDLVRPKPDAISRIVGAEGGLAGVMTIIRRVAPTESPVLLLGETGTGKELLAEAVHELSPRRQGPMVRVNCGALPDSLVDSELFGHERGAFTGAESRHEGRFERAHGGTLFLDEIGELPPSGQVRLLRVLQDGLVERVGGASAVEVNVRVVAATHRPLEELSEAGRFRRDLFYRLAVLPVRVPPLRERQQDIPALVTHFLERGAKALRRSDIPVVERGSIDRALAYDWPGNVLELANVVERALILSHDGEVSLEPFPGSDRKHTIGPVSDRLDDVVRWHVKAVLNRTRGQIHGPNGAAEILDVRPGTLRHRLDRLGVAYGRRWVSSDDC